MLDAVEAGREVPDDELRFEDTVQDRPPGGAVVGRGGVVPDTVRDRSQTKGGMVATVDGVLEIGGQHSPLASIPRK